jgi:integrase
VGTVVERKRKGGSIGYHAQVSIQIAGVNHRETKTFDREAAAWAWIKKREHELRKPGGLSAAKADDPILSAVIDRYTRESRRALGRTKTQVLNTIKGFDLAARPCSKITSADIVAFASELAIGRQPQTVSNYLSHLGSVFAIARPAWGYPLDPSAMKDAFTVATRLGITGKSKGRDRRPTLDELDRLMRHFGDRQIRRASSVPMQWVIAAAIFTTRRQEEITRLAWADLDEAEGRILVRDMKNPGETAGNDVWCDLPAPALDVLRAMPRTGPLIFPYSTYAISAAFTRACALLGIADLKFHDLRHEGVTRLFEMGRSIPHVATVSGHRSWMSLKRYTHVRRAGDRFADWPWLAIVTQPPPVARSASYPFALEA